MAQWFKWWKDATFMKIFGVAMLAMVIAVLSAVLIELGWVISVVAACIGGYTMKRILFKRLDEIAEERRNLKESK